MSRNSSITSFFKPVPRSSQQNSSQSSQQTPAPSVRTPTRTKPLSQPRKQSPLKQPIFRSPLPPTPSPPKLHHSSSPPVPSKQTRDRNDVIRDSEDDDLGSEFMSSEDDLPDLFARPSGVASKVVPTPPPRNKLLETPRAKRTALEFHSSPLTIMPKHKFDIRALMQHAEADDAIEASERRLNEFQAEESAREALANDTSTHLAEEPRSLHDRMLHTFSDPGNSQEEGARTKLLHAVKRTEATEQRKQLHFFAYYDESRRNNGVSTIEARTPFPVSAAKGDWEFLADASQRSAYFEDGVPMNIQLLRQNIPDEILLWVLRDTPHQKSKKLREEYLRLLYHCREQTLRLIDGDLIDQLFREVGAADHVFQTQGKVVTGEVLEQEDSPYSQRDWIDVRAVLGILCESSTGVSLSAQTRAVSILLRLGMDDLLREDGLVMHDYEESISWLVKSVDEQSWDTFCADVTLSLYTFVDVTSLRQAAASSIPLTCPRLVDLRRRLALVFIFDDPQWGRTAPSKTLSIRSLIDRLDAKEFIIGRHYKEFTELGALVELLDFAIGDGSPPTTIGGGPQSIKQFNAEIDELARKINVMYSKIPAHGSAVPTRLGPRQRLLDLEKTLSHATRTRPPPMQNILGIEPIDEEEVVDPRQQAFMNRFLSRGAQA